MRCDECGDVLGGALLETLGRIVSLPDASGDHACECGHPEMRRLPDGVYRCPACGSEVTPITASVSWKSPEHTEAYWSGWLDGRYGDPKKFTHNRRLAKWDGAADRLDYYRGHRAGYEARLKKVTLVEASYLPDAPANASACQHASGLWPSPVRLFLSLVDDT